MSSTGDEVDDRIIALVVIAVVLVVSSTGDEVDDGIITLVVVS